MGLVLWHPMIPLQDHHELGTSGDPQVGGSPVWVTSSSIPSLQGSGAW